MRNFSIIFSGMVISDNKECGPIGIIFALMSRVAAIVIVVIMGALVDIVWQERDLPFMAALRELRRGGDR